MCEPSNTYGWAEFGPWANQFADCFIASPVKKEGLPSLLVWNFLSTQIHLPVVCHLARGLIPLGLALPWLSQRELGHLPCECPRTEEAGNSPWRLGRDGQHQHQSICWTPAVCRVLGQCWGGKLWGMSWHLAVFCLMGDSRLIQMKKQKEFHRF